VSLINCLFSYVQVRTRMIEMVSKGLATLEVWVYDFFFLKKLYTILSFARY